MTGNSQILGTHTHGLTLLAVLTVGTGSRGVETLPRMTRYDAT